MSGDQPGQWTVPPARAHLMVGDIVHGHAGSALGRDHYECSRVEAVARDWVVVRHLDDGEVCAAVTPETTQWLAAYTDPSKGGDHTAGCPYHERVRL